MSKRAFNVNVYETEIRGALADAAMLRYGKTRTVLKFDNHTGQVKEVEVKLGPRTQIRVETQRLLRVDPKTNRLQISKHGNNPSTDRWLNLRPLWNFKEGQYVLAGLVDEQGTSVRFVELPRWEWQLPDIEQAAAQLAGSLGPIQQPLPLTKEKPVEQPKQRAPQVIRRTDKSKILDDLEF